MKYKAGTKYTVEIDDCCVKGNFTATLLHDADSEKYDELQFDNGVVLTSHWGCILKEVKA